MTFEELDKTLDALGGHAPFLLSLNDGEDNELTMRIASSFVGEQREVSESDEPNTALRRLLTESRPLLVNEERVYEIVFDRYIIYQVSSESYCSGDPNGKFSGRFLRIYESSALLNRLGEFTDAQVLEDGSHYPGKWTHYGIVTQNHIIDIVSLDEPKVNISRGT